MSERSPESRTPSPGSNGISTRADFRAALERSGVETVSFPSGLRARLARPPIFAALALGRKGTELQAKITDTKPGEVKTEDVIAFTDWLTDTLSRLFVQPRFSGAPGVEEIGLEDISLPDLKFIFRWLRGEVVPGDSAPEDLTTFSGGQREGSVPGGSGAAQPVPPERTP